LDEVVEAHLQSGFGDGEDLFDPNKAKKGLYCSAYVNPGARRVIFPE
jgi:hypothetical protein